MSYLCCYEGYSDNGRCMAEGPLLPAAAAYLVWGQLDKKIISTSCKPTSAKHHSSRFTKRICIVIAIIGPNSSRHPLLLPDSLKTIESPP